MSHSLRRGVQLNHIQAGTPSAKFEPKLSIWLISILSSFGGNKLKRDRVYPAISGADLAARFGPVGSSVSGWWLGRQKWPIFIVRAAGAARLNGVLSRRAIRTYYSRSGRQLIPVPGAVLPHEVARCRAWPSWQVAAVITALIATVGSARLCHPASSGAAGERSSKRLPCCSRAPRYRRWALPRILADGRGCRYLRQSDVVLGDIRGDENDIARRLALEA